MKLAIVGCSELVTLAGPARPRTGAELRDLAIVRDGVMLIHDGRIECVGPRRDITIDCDVEIVDAGGRDRDAGIY